MRVRFARSAAGTHAGAAARNDPPGARRDGGFEGRDLVLRSGRRLEYLDAVIFATGYKAGT